MAKRNICEYSNRCTNQRREFNFHLKNVIVTAQGDMADHLSQHKYGWMVASSGITTAPKYVHEKGFIDIFEVLQGISQDICGG